MPTVHTRRHAAKRRRARPAVTRRPPPPKVNPLRADPSRTAGLRRGFGAELGRKFGRLRLAVYDLIAREDALGLRPAALGFPHNVRWSYRSDPDKIRQFQAWLRGQLDENLTGASDEALWARYAEAGYRKGAGRAFDDARKRQRALQPSALYGGAREEFLRSSFGHPVAAGRIKVLAGRAFDDLQGVTADMALRMSRILTDGLVQGLSPRDVARRLAAEVDLGKRRALLIARTEIIRAHAEGQLDALEGLGVTEVGVDVEVEFSTAGDVKVCPDCAALEGVVLPIAKAHGRIPVHPACRCAWLPAVLPSDPAPPAGFGRLLGSGGSR